MANRVKIEDIRVGDIFTSTFLVTSHAVKTSRDGVDYLALTLADASGTIEGRVWIDARSLAARCAVDDFVAIRGEAEAFGNGISLTIHDLERVDDAQIDLKSFFTHSRWDADDMFAQLRNLLDQTLTIAPLRAFFDSVFADDNLVGQLKAAPAAMKNHHAYRGGLLEHCLSMSRLAVRICSHYAAYYPGMIQVDLVVSGCVLHDLAKIRELDFRRAIRYSTQGRLVGHIPMVSQWITDFARKSAIDLPQDLVTELKHLVLSHHGRQEFGSPVLPQTPEAQLLHFIDMMDSRMNIFAGLMPQPGAREYWTDYQRSMEAPLYFRGDVPWVPEPAFSQHDLDGPGSEAHTAPALPHEP